MSRRNEIYVSSKTLRGLILLAQSHPGKTDEFGVTRKASADDIAEEFLQRIFTEFPQLTKLQKEIDRLEKETIEELRNKK